MAAEPAGDQTAWLAVCGVGHAALARDTAAAVSLAGAIGQANDSSGWKGRPARPR